MKKQTVLIAALTLVAGVAGTALADVWMPPVPSPLYIKFDNKEQIAPRGNIVAPSGALESNWGIMKVTTIAEGNTAVDPQNFTSKSPPIWVDSANAEITGIFYGIQLSSINGSIINSKNGWIDLYYDDQPNADLGSATLAQRTGDSQFTNFTDGTFLARIAFINGAITPLDPNASITGDSLPVAGGFSGSASSYGAVDLSAGGAWASLLDGNYFTTLLGFNTADLKFRNIYESTGSHDWDQPQLGIFGAQSSDPARAYTVPEPSTFALLGFGLLGAGFMARRKRS